VAAPERVAVEAVVGFGHGMREAGLPASVADDLVLVDALAEVDVRSRTQVYWAARAAYVRRPEDGAAFDAHFERFWAGLGPPGTAVAEHAESDPRMTAPQVGGESLPQSRRESRAGELLGGGRMRATREVPTAPGEEDGGGRRYGALAAWSPADVQSRPEPLGYATDELAAVRALAGELRRSAPERRCRRLRSARVAGRLDVRETLRRSMRTDGEPLAPAFAAPSVRPRRLVLLCDVSGSMERYARIVLASLQAAVAAGIRAEAFVFATRLTRLTPALSRHDVGRALEEARAQVQDWAGGTRIGDALAAFNREHGPRGLARGGIVVVISDGWDRGDPERLAAEVDRLRLQARRLVWVNPRPGTLDGQPLAIGLRAVLPLVDDYVAGHDVRALAGLASVLAGVDRNRPARRARTLRSAAP
jgi:uncharacterized protein with von Willebrand factor type A (vWA) domain